MFGRGKSKRVRFFCACGQSLTATLRLLSRPFPCPKCGRALHTPRVKESDKGWVVRFDCPLCNFRTNAPISRHGSRVVCEHCGAEVEAPQVFEDDRHNAATQKPEGQVPVYAQPTMAMPAVGAQPAPEPPADSATEQEADDAPTPEGRTAMLKRVMNEEADRLEETKAKVSARRAAAFRVSPLVWTATGGALLVLIGSFLPWFSSGGKSASFPDLLTESPWRETLPGPALWAAGYYGWIALTLAALWLCHDTPRRGTFLWILFLSAATGAAVGRTFLVAAGTGAPLAGFHLAAVGLLAVAGAGALTLWNSIARLGVSVLLTLVASVAIIGSFTSWFGITSADVSIKAVVAYEDSPETGTTRAAVTLVVRNQSRKAIMVNASGDAKATDGARPFSVAIERQCGGEWKQAVEGKTFGNATRVEPGKESELRFSVCPVWDLTVTGSESLSPKPETLVGQYRVRLESQGKAIVKTFDIPGVPYPEVDAAALFAKAQAAEKDGRPGEADELYETIERKYAKTPYGPKATEARRNVGGDARDERETRQINAAIAELRRLEDQKAVAVKSRPPDRDDGRAVAGVDKMDADIQILTTRIAEARQALWRLLAQKAERATLDGRYEEALRTLSLLADQKPDGQYAQRGETLRADAVRRAAEAATREGVAQVNTAMAADQLLPALATARTLRRGEIRGTAGSNDVRLAAESIYQRKCDEVAARLREVTCAKRARLYESFLESRTDLAADLRAELTLEMKSCRTREEKAAELVARIETLRANTTPWFEAVKSLLDGYSDTDAATPYLSRKAAVEAWAKGRTQQ